MLVFFALVMCISEVVLLCLRTRDSSHSVISGMATPQVAMMTTR